MAQLQGVVIVYVYRGCMKVYPTMCITMSVIVFVTVRMTMCVNVYVFV